MEKFDYVKKAFADEPTIHQMENNQQLTPLHIDLIKTGISGGVTVKEDTVALQFWGWELILLKDGTYFINDTSGG